MDALSQSPTVVLFTRTGDWDEPQVTEADILQELQAAGYGAAVARNLPELVTALGTATEPIVVFFDWQALGIYAISDFYRAATYNPLWESRHVIEERRKSGAVVGCVIVWHQQLAGYGELIAPSAVNGDVFLRYPFLPGEVVRWVRRLMADPQHDFRELSDDRLSP